MGLLVFDVVGFAVLFVLAVVHFATRRSNHWLGVVLVGVAVMMLGAVLYPPAIDHRLAHLLLRGIIIGLFTVWVGLWMQFYPTRRQIERPKWPVWLLTFVIFTVGLGLMGADFYGPFPQWGFVAFFAVGGFVAGVASLISVEWSSVKRLFWSLLGGGSRGP